jgi:hypothetical protein
MLEMAYWDLSTGSRIRWFDGSLGSSVAVTPDGRHAVSGSFNITSNDTGCGWARTVYPVQYWDLSTGACLETVACAEPLCSVAGIPGGTRIVVGGIWGLLALAGL